MLGGEIRRYWMVTAAIYFAPAIVFRFRIHSYLVTVSANQIHHFLHGTPQMLIVSHHLHPRIEAVYRVKAEHLLPR